MPEEVISILFTVFFAESGISRRRIDQAEKLKGENALLLFCRKEKQFIAIAPMPIACAMISYISIIFSS